MPVRIPRVASSADGDWSPALPGLQRLRLDVVVVVQAIVTALMVGMIWTVHLLHYELFPLVGAAAWDRYESFGPWLVEGLCVLVLLSARPRNLRVLAFVSAFLMLFILVDTAAFSAPAHGVLLDHWDRDTYDRLMVVNLVRAWLWTAKGVVAVWMLWLVVTRSHAPRPEGL